MFGTLGCEDDHAALVESAAIAVNERWSANPTHVASWSQLGESERERWRDAVCISINAALHETPERS